MAVPPPPPSPRSEKQASRLSLRAARARHVEALGAAGVERETARIAARLVTALNGDGAIAGYVAHRGEPDVLGVLLALHAQGREVALPRVEEGTMRFVAWRPETALVAGFAGIREPVSDREVVPATLLVPLVGFDRRGGRLGRGAGCYDRWLAAHPGTRTIGVAWAVQQCDAVPADAWDVRLDAIVTEAEWIAP